MARRYPADRCVASLLPVVVVAQIVAIPGALVTPKAGGMRRQSLPRRNTER
jgi:hypothetical protein